MEKHNISGLDCLKVKKQSHTNKAMILIHGYGASMNDLAPLADYINFSGDFYFPDGPLSIPISPHMMGKAWFPIDMQALEQAMSKGGHRSFYNLYPQAFQDSLIELEAFISNLKNEYQEIIIGGFSQGAMCSLHLAFRQKLKKLILMSGNPIGLSEINFKDHQLDFFQSHGTQDAVLSFTDAKSLYDTLTEQNSRGIFEAFNGGHEIPSSALKKLNEFLINE